MPVTQANRLARSQRSRIRKNSGEVLVGQVEERGSLSHVIDVSNPGKPNHLAVGPIKDITVSDTNRDADDRFVLLQIGIEWLHDLLGFPIAGENAPVLFCTLFIVGVTLPRFIECRKEKCRDVHAVGPCQ